MAPKPKKDKPKNLDGTGWTLADIGVNIDAPEVVRVVPGKGVLNRTTGTASNPAAFTLGLTGGVSGQRVIPTTAGKLPQASEPTGINPYLPDAVGTSPEGIVASPNAMTPERQQVKNYLDNPNIIENVTSSTKNWLSNLFDTSDPDKEAFFGLENVWDKGLTGIGWFYDKINQVGSYTTSLAPGGLDTFSWDQAGDISVGQAAVTNQAALNEQLGPLGFAAGTIVNGLGVLGGTLGEATGAKFTQDNFNILDPAQRKAAFEEDTAGKWASGLTDTAFTIFADPLIAGGKVAKIARLRWVDRPVQTIEDVNRVTNELKTGAVQLAAGESGRMAPVAQFAAWATEKTADGQRARSVMDIYMHPVIRRAADRDGITAALANADNYDDASLVIRYAYGDASARSELLAKRADLADQMDLAQRTAMETRIAYNPEVRQAQLDKYGNRLGKLEEELQKVKDAHAVGEADDAALDFAHRQVLKATEDYNFVYNIELPDPLANPVSKADRDAALRVVKELEARDKFFQKALQDEQQNVGAMFGSLATSERAATKGFAADNAFGRAVESRRQASAEAASQAARTRGARAATADGGTKKVRIWQSDVFGNNGMTRMLRLWRYPGMEAPSGYITTKGAGSQESVREIMAMLNEIKIYSGNSRTVTLSNKVKRSGGKEITVPVTGEVGGVARKEQLVKMYMDALSDTTAGTQAAKVAVDRIERAVMQDIAKWYGVPKAQTDNLLWTAQGKKKDLLDQIRNEGYWVENGQINKSPYLESQLQNGTYMLNFRAFEKLARVHADKPWIKGGDQFLTDAGTKANEFYNAFNDLWRPAVLLRLGYTQRNVLEGLFRSSAFLFSLEPAKWAGKSAGLGVRNTVLRQIGRQDIKALNKMGTTERFVKWRTTQAAAMDDQILKHEATLAEFQKELASAPPHLADDIAEDIKFTQKMLDDAKVRRADLDVDAVAKSLYGQQAMAKRRVFDGSIPGPDGLTLRSAFNNEGGYADVAWANMSADNTTRSVASLTSLQYKRLLRNTVAKTHVSVSPDRFDEYATGVATALSHFKNSEVGAMVINGATPDEIATFLRKTPEGREIAAFVTGAEITKKGKTFSQRIVSYDDALDYAETIINRFAQLAPTPELRAYARSANVMEDAAVKTMLEAVPRESLKPVIGNIAEEVGAFSIRDIYRKTINKGFEILGTMPEDAFVRGPFYGMRYRSTVNQLMEMYKAQIPGGRLSMKDATQIQRIAHRRALKDTKDWLYTIDRRTLLGKYGEYMFPFISATQNSVSAVGRIIWNDPSVAGVLSLLWQAPDKMGITDENGKISVSMPLDFIPQAVKDATGLDNMLNMEFEKSQFNVVFPESGFGFLPRFGPLGAVPASEMMKHGWFGQSIETPEWAKGLLDGAFGEGAADEFWRNWKDYLFGEDQGVSAEMLSWDKIAPPIAAKFIQMWQGEGSSSAYTYQYNLQLRTEYAKYMAGYRDEPPTAEEIKTRTNNFQLVRILANLTAFTPPSYESKLDPLIKAIRENDRVHGLDGSRISNDQFGNLLLMLGDFSNSKNNAGISVASADSVGIARKHAALIGTIAPNLGDDLNTLGILFNQDPNALYDESAYAWQRATNIPGVSEQFRSLQSPEEALVASQKNAGWTAYIQLMDQLQALLEQRGLKSFRSAGAEQLRAVRDQAIAQLRDNPMYEGWYDDYMDFGSQRTNNAVEVLSKAVSNKAWMEEYGGKPIWQAADLYLYHRNMVLEGLRASGKGINDSSNRQIREYWDTVRADLIQTYNGWGTIANRYLSADDNPQQPGASFYDTTSTTAQTGLQVLDDVTGEGDGYRG